MNKKLLIASLILLFIGLILIASGIGLGGTEHLAQTNIDRISDIINKKSEDPYKIVTKELEDFSNMRLSFEYKNFSIKESLNGKNYVEFVNIERPNYNINVRNDTLLIHEDSKPKNTIINLNRIKNGLLRGRFNDPNDFTLYVSKSNFNNIDVSHEMGHIKMDNIVCERLNMRNSMGSIRANDCEINFGYIDQSMGKVELDNLKVNKRLRVSVKMGKFEGGIIYDKNKYYNIDAITEMGSISIDPLFKNSNRKNEEKVDLILKTEMGKIELNAK